MADSTNRERFQAELVRQYTDLFSSGDPDYAYAAKMGTPEKLAKQMTDALSIGSANKEGKGIRRACKALGVAYTYKGIREFLNG